MFLSRLTLSPSFFGRRLAENPFAIHQVVEVACDGDVRPLYRLERTAGSSVILVQSNVMPNWDHEAVDRRAFLSIETRPLSWNVEAGKRFVFRLAGNPTKREKDGGRKRRAILDPDGQVAWLKRKMEDAGVRVERVNLVSSWTQKSYRGVPRQDRQHASHVGVMFEGAIVVQDTDKFTSALKAGVGPGKAYGLGLLSVIPIS